MKTTPTIAAAPIERRLAAMKELYNAGVKTVCQLAPIFPA